MPLHDFGREFTALIRLGETTRDFVLVRYLDCVSAAKTGVADVELAAGESPRRDLAEHE